MIYTDEDLEERFEDIIGPSYYEKEPLTPIIIAVSNNYLGYVDTKPLHGSQVKFPAEEQVRLHKKYPSFEDYTFYGLKLKPNRELYNTIYRNGDRILLVSPKDIRSKMVKELETSLELLKSVKGE